MAKERMKITLEMDLERAKYLIQALEVVARIGMGQFKDMAEFLQPMMDWDTKQEIESYLKHRIFPELSNNQFSGIRQDCVPEASQVAWDAYQHIRREISWLREKKDWRDQPRDWHTMMGVNFDEPMKVSKLEGDFKVERHPPIRWDNE